MNNYQLVRLLHKRRSKAERELNALDTAIKALEDGGRMRRKRRKRRRRGKAKAKRRTTYLPRRRRAKAQSTQEQAA